MNGVIEVKSMHREREKKRKKGRQKMRKTIHRVTASTVTEGWRPMASTIFNKNK